MSDGIHNRLLGAIRAAPDDDAPRLVYADWLQEHGDPVRADFVRAQLERARLSPWEERYLELEVQEYGWLQDNQERWRARLPTPRGVYWGPFRRGFADKLVFHDLGQFEEEARTLREASFVDAMAIPWPRFGHTPPLDPILGIRELEVGGTLYDEASVDWLADSEALASLRSLSLPASHIEEEPYLRLVSSPHLRGLTSLEVHDHMMGDDVMVHLAQAGTMKGLNHLKVSVSTPAEYGSQGRHAPELGIIGLGALGGWEGAVTLKSLDVSGNPLGDYGLQNLLSLPVLSGLETLRAVGSCEPFGTLAFDGFVRAHARLRLQHVALGFFSFGEEGAAALAGAQCLSQLRVLELNFAHQESESALERLFAADWLHGVRVMDLAGCGSGWVDVLARHPPERLHSLTLTLRSQDAKAAIRHLVDSGLSNQLRHLHITHSISGDAMAELVDVSSAFALLISLRLGNYRHDTERVQSLLDSPLASQLQRLQLAREPHA